MTYKDIDIEDFKAKKTQGMYDREIAEAYGCCRATIDRFKRYAGLGTSNYFLTNEQIEFIKENYLTMTIAKIAEKLDIGTSTVSRVASTLGLKHTDEQRRAKVLANPSLYYLGREIPEEERKKISNTIKEKLRKDRIRERYGMPRLTNRRVTKMSKHQAYIRKRLREYGYIVNYADTTILYDENTNRSEYYEQEAKKYGQVMSVEDGNKTAEVCG